MDQILPIQKVIHGGGCVEALPQVFEEFHIKRALIVTSPSALRTGLVERVSRALNGHAIRVMGDVPAHNKASAALQAAAMLRDFEADAVISIGGGSAIDAGKSVQLITQEGITDLPGLRTLWNDSGHAPLPPKPSSITLIAIPTTLSGAEFSYSCAITDDASLEKMIFLRRDLTPSVILLDPEMVTQTPAQLWSSTGIKLMDHAVEQIYSQKTHTVAQSMCSEGLRILYGALPRASEERDLESTMQCMYAKWLICFGMLNVTLGLSHGVGHQIGPLWGVAHGVTSCVTLPHAFRYNREYARNEEMKVAAALGIHQGQGDTEDEVLERTADAIEAFIRSMGLPASLREVGGHEADFEALAPRIMRDPIAQGNPRSLSTAAGIVDFLHMAWVG